MTRSDRDAKKHKLRVQARNTYIDQEDYDTLLSVFDGHGARVGEGVGSLSLDLPRGLYTIRSERFGELGEDTVILHETAQKKTIPAPRRHSAMPSSDTLHTHEFLQGAAYEFSRKTTWYNPDATQDDPLLMILVRATGDGDHSGTLPARKLLLMDENRAIVTRFEPDRIKGHAGEGWMVFSARLAAGNYILSDIREKQAVSLPILLTRKRWDTLVFVPVETGPRLSAASIDMCRRNEGYNPDDTFTQAIDAAIQGLGMRLDLLPNDLRNEAIYGKFSHPLHGLIGAHAHFLGPKRSERLEQQVLHNLWRLLEGSADVVALLLLAREREDGRLPGSMDDLNAMAREAFGEALNTKLPFAFPPMLRTSLDILVRASLQVPELIAEGSWLEAAALSSYADGPWAVWDQKNTVVPQGTEAQTPEPLTPQRLYPIIKRAIARESDRDAGSIFADDRLDDLLDNQSNRIPGILNAIAEEMPDVRLDLVQRSMPGSNRVRDLQRQIRDEAVPFAPEQSGLGPNADLPQWLVTMVKSRMEADGGDYDPVAVARMANVPLASIRRAGSLSD